MSGPHAIDVVIPTAGRDSLAALLQALVAGHAAERLGGRVIVVADRRSIDATPLRAPGAEVLRGPGRGPAAARNAGWRAAGAEWVAFLDDDVVPEPDWAQQLLEDIGSLSASVAGSQGVVRVPLPPDRPPTDWERNVAGLERARWATADMAYRRAALAAVGGFDERFERAYREDADLGLRLVRAGWRIERGRRTVAHPVRAADPWVSVRLQAGNADDVLMRALHGPDWRAAAGAPPGRLRRHLITVAAGAGAITAAASGRRRLALAGGLGCAAGSGALASARIARGPRTVPEVLKMISTSAALPPAAAWHRARPRAPAAAARRHGARPSSHGGAAGSAPRDRSHARAVAGAQAPAAERPDAVLLDRDGTLIVDVPYNGDPARVEAVRGARAALDRLRAVGLPSASSPIRAAWRAG